MSRSTTDVRELPGFILARKNADNSLSVINQLIISLYIISLKEHFRYKVCGFNAGTIPVISGQPGLENFLGQL